MVDGGPCDAVLGSRVQTSTNLPPLGTFVFLVTDFVRDQLCQES